MIVGWFENGVMLCGLDAGKCGLNGEDCRGHLKGCFLFFDYNILVDYLRLW